MNDTPGFKIPVNIPGAPERVTWRQLVETSRPLLRVSFDAFQRKPGAYEAALQQATWWHFWVLVGVSSLISAAASAFTLMALEVQVAALFPGYQTNFLRPIAGLVIAIPVSFFAFYAGCFASHWWAANMAGGQASLIAHSYVLVVIWAAENILAAILTLGLTLFGLAGVALLIAVAIVIYALVVMAGHIGQLYRFPDRSRTWITAGVMVVTSWMVSILLQDILL